MKKLNQRSVVTFFVTLSISVLISAFLCNNPFAATPELQTPKLLAVLPEYCPTPDGMAIDSEGRLCVACPNYADQSKPAVVIRIDKSGKIEKWFNVPVLKETGVACPMGIAFGRDGELFICDNQGWTGKAEGLFKGRLLECKIQGKGDDAKITTRTIANGIEHPNGVRFHNGKIYITNSLMTKIKHKSGLLVSGVYCFDPTETKTITITNTAEDANLLLTALTYNKDCQYGIDGIAFDKSGDLYLGNFGDGTILRAKIDDKGKTVGAEVWAKNPKNLRTTDGICFDDNGNLYVADFSENAIAIITPDAKVHRIAKSPDSDGANGELDQPGEPISWNGKLVITCFDAVIGPDKVNTKHDKPYTITTLDLIKGKL
ncbi:MAG: SMP-30/gluconolactonase/LRE family protein [Planctomycetaceae bacterium]|jgi:sugar lactone lactonase YvrE|nr:SMP-30/gluconolactonase/LRE family protein [Planctomycetaceae bacterium]